MKKAALIALVVGLTAASGASAGGRHYGHGYYGHGFYPAHHRFGYGHHYGRGHYRGHYRRHHRRHHRDHFGYLAAGALLGGVIVHSLNRPAVVEERVVYRRPLRRVEPVVEYRYETVPEPEYEAIPAEPPPYYYRKDVDGECWLIERAEDGSETITPQDPRICG